MNMKYYMMKNHVEEIKIYAIPEFQEPSKGWSIINESDVDTIIIMMAIQKSAKTNLNALLMNKDHKIELPAVSKDFITHLEVSKL